MSTIKALEKVFAATVENRLPFQSKAAIYKRLEAQGLIQPYSEINGRDRFGAIEVKGYQLTQLGMLTYCTSCTDQTTVPHEVKP